MAYAKVTKGWKRSKEQRGGRNKGYGKEQGGAPDELLTRAV